ncbi:putative acyl-CoA dehydrogenase [Melioribacter roseus P3M-2]|uniref:Putative acyl-CoA dehydrogenase n=1 Tax=Melioribacter roseus (strain DSM 23840 / JCM 17771 / VKM B-2668 / P3M-2) TaxID=1191523 RepID=I6ZVD9_MELRP|nr:acyl-CoA dehydrogenase family protein [Melioribacter roseus]AFN75969.1 putative acyl-CoA dehydrogenase [Melioribacter roseus P3M-2]
MNFELDDNYGLLKNTVRDFAENEIRPAAKQLDENEEFSLEITKKMGEMGFLGVTVSPDYGGQGLDYLSYIIIVEELARVDASQAATVAAHNSLGTGPIYRYGSKEQKEKYLPDLTAGKALWAFGLTEPNAGSDSNGTNTSAVRTEQGWILNGQKTFITNGDTPLTIGATIKALTGIKDKGHKEFSCFLLETGTPGFTTSTLKGKMMWRASNTAELFMSDCFVPEENLLGKIGEGSKIMLSTLDSGRLAIAAMGLGCAQGAFELALKYSKTRKQFGRFIGDFEVNSFKLADMAMKIELARTFLYKACWLKDNNKPFTTEAAMAKLYCSEIAREVADEALQIHGGYGLMKEYEIERFYRDQRLLQIGEGTSEIQRIVIARQLGLNPIF